MAVDTKLTKTPYRKEKYTEEQLLALYEGTLFYSASY